MIKDIFFQNPIFLMIIAAIILILSVSFSIQNEKIAKKSLYFSFFNISLAIFCLVGFSGVIKGNSLIENIYSYYVLFNLVYFLIFFIFTFSTFSLKANHYLLFIKSFRESNLNAYYVVDRNERVKDISSTLLEELGLEKNDVIGKKLFKSLNKKTRIQKLNDSESSNKLLERFYLDFKKTANVGDQIVQEIIFLNHEGKEVILKVIIQPVFILGRYKGRTAFGEIKNDFDLLSIEKKLSSSVEDLEGIKEKFIATLEISKEGLFTIDLNENTIWLSDSLKNMLKFKSNIVDLEEYRDLIEPTDRLLYLDKLSGLNLNKEFYNQSYRIKIDNDYHWFEERGKRLFENQNMAVIMGTANPIKNIHFKNSNVDVLDNVTDGSLLANKLRELIEENKYFYLVLFELSNMSELNDKHGWQFGNMVISNYIKKIKESFITENGDIYRLTGIRFAALITNPNKISAIRNGATRDPNFMDIKISYGSITCNLNVKAGVADTEVFGINESSLYIAAEQALNETRKENNVYNTIFYSDLNNKYDN